MHSILVYGDSLSWGIIPGTRRRFAFHQRWPGVMEIELRQTGIDARVIEDCLNGRRTVLEDPTKAGRNGLDGLQQRIEINSPLSLVVLFLGTNDFQSVHEFHAEQSAQGLASLVDAIRATPIEPGMPTPKILLVAPPTVQSPKHNMAAKFQGAETKSAGLAEAIDNIAKEKRCEFFDAAKVTPTSVIDGVHLDQEQHLALATVLAATVAEILADY
ncbi:SGNH/GDSL hydrolase family protein [Rhodopirellula baltica]|uniref:Arylesterase protein n=1 Tax=Rhodopirellula baltica SWK14 TaxID=993516 RepID=L7CIT9_RHOBT|nr:SGNH/GDSL hydrolase family protein [Rhodopirellula baltica]ELP33765.1 arylesterase protein [Rhodopirellula baltica SWK14]